MLGIHHPLVKSIRKAARKGSRTDDGFAVAEGFHLLREALRSGIPVGAVLATPAAAAQLPGGPLLHLVTDALLSQISSVEASQGVISLLKLEDHAPARCLEDSSAVLAIALDGIQDPGNAGAIVRSAEAFGATGVIFLTGTVSPWNPKTLRASAGSLLRLPFAVCDWESFHHLIETREIALYAACAHDGRWIQEVPLRAPTAILIGNEGRGIPPAHEELATPVRIPTAGVESLNAALAAGIMLYEARRQRS